MSDSKPPASALSDVDLIRLLTRDAAGQPADVLAEGEAEALRRGLPIDEGFIPSETEDRSIAEFTRGVAEASDREDGDAFQNGGRDIVCTQCGGERFKKQQILLNTRGMTFLKLDWLNRDATALICVRCGLVQLFANI